MKRLAICLACLGSVGFVACRDYGALEGVDDLSAVQPGDLGDDQAGDPSGDDGSVADLGDADLTPSCAPIPHDRDAGPPPNPNITWASEQPYFPFPQPDGGAPLGRPQRLTAGDGDGDGRPDVVTVTPNGTTNGSQLAYVRGTVTAGHADLLPAWTANSTTPVGQVVLADFLPDESAAAAPRAELITSFDGLQGGSVQKATVSVLRLTATGVFPIMPTLDLADVTGPDAKPTSRTVALAGGDLDGDGKAELILALNHHDGASGPPYPAGGLLVLWSGAVSAVGNGITPPFFDWSNRKSSYVEVAAAHPALLAVADIDGDCVPEIVVAGGSTDGAATAVQIVRQPPMTTRTLATATTGTLGDGQALSMTVLDLDRVGKRSILLVRNSDYVLLDPQAGSLDSAAFDRRTRAINAPGSTCSGGDVGCLVAPRAVVSADFDRDGADDVYLFGYFSWQVPTAIKGAYYRNDSLGDLVRTPASGAVLHDPTATARFNIVDARAVDIDGDGRKEVVLVDDGNRYGMFLHRVGP